MNQNKAEFKSIILREEDGKSTTYTLKVKPSTKTEFKLITSFTLQDNVCLELVNNHLVDVLNDLPFSTSHFNKIEINLNFDKLASLIIIKDDVVAYSEELNFEHFDKYKNSLIHRIMWISFEDHPILPIRECLNSINSNIDRIGDLVYSNKLEESN